MGVKIKNPTGGMFIRSYNPRERIVYSITDTRKYNYLVRKDKAKQDGIDMDVYFVWSALIIVVRNL